MYQLCRICRRAFTFVFPLLHALSAACALIFLNKPLRILTLKVQLLPGDTCRLGKRSVEASRILRTSLDTCRARNAFLRIRLSEILGIYGADRTHLCAGTAIYAHRVRSRMDGQANRLALRHRARDCQRCQSPSHRIYVSTYEALELLGANPAEFKHLLDVILIRPVLRNLGEHRVLSDKRSRTYHVEALLTRIGVQLV